MQILKADGGFSYLLFSTFAYLLDICPRSKTSAFRIRIIKPKSLVPMVLYHPNIHYFLVKKFSVHQVDTLVLTPSLSAFYYFYYKPDKHTR